MGVAVRRWMLVVLVVVAFPAQATLLSRLGGAAAYDDVLNITWLVVLFVSEVPTWTLAIWIAATVGPIAVLGARKDGQRAG